MNKQKIDMPADFEDIPPAEDQKTESPDQIKDIPPPLESTTGPDSDTGPIVTRDGITGPKEKKPEKPKDEPEDGKEEPEMIGIELNYPHFHPTGGRIVCDGYFIDPGMTKGGLHIPPKRMSRDSYDRKRSNPQEDLTFFVVAMCPTVNRYLRKENMLPKYHNKEIPLEIGDKIVVSPMMEAITVQEDGIDYYIWHFMDILGFYKDPGNMKRWMEQHGPRARKGK